MEKPMLSITLSLLTLTLALSHGITHPAAASSRRTPQITVLGTVYCDICSNNSFSRHSYFLPGVEVKIECKFKATAPRTAEEITFTVNRTTNRYGWYRLEVPSVDGIECAAGESAVVSACRASLVGSSSSKCGVPGYKSTTDVVYFKSSEANICILASVPSASGLPPGTRPCVGLGLGLGTKTFASKT